MKRILPLVALLSLLGWASVSDTSSRDVTAPPSSASPSVVSPPTFVETPPPNPLPEEPLPYPSVEAEIGKVVAYLTVPRLGMDRYPVRMGVSAAVLALGPGVYKGTPEPGEGNFTLAGHRITPVGPWNHGPFRYVDTLVDGDVAFVAYKGKTYKYVYEETLIVSPENVNVLRDGKADMTFTACHPPGYATERIVIHWGLKWTK